MTAPLVFALDAEPLAASLCAQLPAVHGTLERRRFPDAESWLRVTCDVAGRDCIIVAGLARPDARFLPLCFLAGTLRELGAASVGLVAPYLCYMRQDTRFHEGEAVTSRLFARLLSSQVDWLVTVDPHLHRFRTLDALYPITTRVVHAAAALGAWLQTQPNLLLVGPDAESAQWVGEVARVSGHPFVVGAKTRAGDRSVSIRLPALSAYAGRTAVIVDDVVASGHTLLECCRQLRAAGFTEVDCACVHGLFAERSDELLLRGGVRRLISTNTIAHASNIVDVAPLLAAAVTGLLAGRAARPPAA